MKGSTITRCEIRRATIQLPGGRCVRIDLTRNADGEPGALALSLGWDSSERPDPARTIYLPGYLITDVREALEALEGDG